MHHPSPMARPARTVVLDGQPDPLYLAHLEAQEEARQARIGLIRARRQLEDAQARIAQAAASAALAECRWTLRGAKPSSTRSEGAGL